MRTTATRRVRFSYRSLFRRTLMGLFLVAWGLLMAWFPAFSDDSIGIRFLPFDTRKLIGGLLVAGGVLFFWWRVGLAPFAGRDAIEFRIEDLVVWTTGDMREVRYRRTGNEQISVDPTDGAVVLSHSGGLTRVPRWFLNDRDLGELLSESSP